MTEEQIKHGERIAKLEVEHTNMKEMFMEMKTVITKDLPKMVRQGFKEIQEEMAEEHKKDMKVIEERIAETEEVIEKMAPIRFLTEHPKLATLMIVGFFTVALSDILSSLYGLI